MVPRLLPAASSLFRLFLAVALLVPPASAAPGEARSVPDPLQEKRETIQRFFEKGDPIPLQVRQAVVRAAQQPPAAVGITDPGQAAQFKQDGADLVKGVDQAMQLQQSQGAIQGVNEGEKIAVQITARVQNTCVLLKIVDAARQEEAVKLYVSRWQSGRTDLTPEKAAKEHAAAQAALGRGQEQQAGATARARAAMSGTLGTSGVPGGDFAATGVRANPDAMKRISATQGTVSRPVVPEPPKPLSAWQQSLMQTAEEHGDRGAAYLIQAENAKGVDRLLLQGAAAGQAIKQGVTKLMAGDPETVERAKVGAMIGASVVALPAAALGATGTGVTLLGLGRATLAVGMPAMNAAGATGSLSAVASETTASNAAAAIWDMSAGRVAGPASALARGVRQSEEVATAARRIETAADDAKAMRMALGADATAGTQYGAFAKARVEARVAGEAPALTERVGVDIAARDAAVAASRKQVGGVCASHSTTVCGIANGAPLELSEVKRVGARVKTEELMTDIRATRERMAAATDPARIAAYEKQVSALRAEMNDTIKIGSAEGLNGDQILALGRKLDLDAARLAGGRGPALNAEIDAALANRQAVLAAFKLGDEGHAVSVMGYGRSAAGEKVYEIYDSAVHRVIYIHERDFNPALGIVLQPKTLDFTRAL